MSQTDKRLICEIDARGKSSRETNHEIKDLIAANEKDIRVLNCEAAHNLAVGILVPVSITFEGSVGYYCGGLMDGPSLEIHGSAGWGLGESMKSGTIRVEGNAGNSCAASMRGGWVVVNGNVGARAGISMKGGLLIVTGDCGYMTGFMMQKGVIIICGNAGPALADSMYEGTVFVGGEIEGLGNDAMIKEPVEQDRVLLHDGLSRWGISPGRAFKKVSAGRRLWNFDKHEMGIWKEAL